MKEGAASFPSVAAYFFKAFLLYPSFAETSSVARAFGAGKRSDQVRNRCPRRAKVVGVEFHRFVWYQIT